MTPTPKQVTDPDDDELGLPPALSDGLDGEEEDFHPGDDEDLGLFDEPEQVGLDVETGLAEPLDAELASGEDDENTRWTEGSEADPTLAGADADLIEGEEYGWTGGDDGPVQDDDWDDGLGVDEEPMLLDGGEEGLQDDDGASEIDDLPPLDEDPPEDDAEEMELEREAFDLALLDDLAEGSLEAEEALIEVGTHGNWPAIAPEHVTVEVLREIDDTAHLAASGAQAVLLHGGRLWHAGPAGPAVDRGGLAGTPCSVSLAGGLLAVGLTGSVLSSRDGGRSVERHALPGGLPRVPVHAAWTEGGHEPRLWAATLDGPMLRADGEGQPFAIVEPDVRTLMLASDAARGLARVLRSGDGSLVVQRSTDGGLSWEAWGAPADGAEGLSSIAVVRDLVLAARETPTPGVLYAREEGPWCEALPGGQPPAILVDEDGDAILYACVGADDGCYLVRRPLSAPGRGPKVVTKLLDREHGRPRAIAGGNDEGGLLLWVVTERLWLRVRAQLDLGAG